MRTYMPNANAHPGTIHDLAWLHFVGCVVIINVRYYKFRETHNTGLMCVDIRVICILKYRHTYTCVDVCLFNIVFAYSHYVYVLYCFHLVHDTHDYTGEHMFVHVTSRSPVCFLFD